MFLPACAYYLRCSTRNRLLATARRLRRPKYLIGTALVVLYFWFFFFRNLRAPGAGDPESYRRNAVLIFSGFTLLQLVFAWFAAGRGVGFREADVQILFSRPFTRFQLLLFKWASNQLAAVIGSLLVALLVARFEGFSYLNLVLGLWLLQTVMAAHTTLFGLVQSKLEAQGGLVARLRFLPALALVAAVPLCVGLAWQAVGGIQSFADAGTLVTVRPLSTLLAPFELLVAPLVTLNAGDFALAAVGPLAILMLHVLVLWRVDIQFEDQALELAAKLQNIRREGLGALQSKRDLVAKPGSPWPLAATGATWKALVWKNVISISRFPRKVMLRIALVIVLMGVLFGSMTRATGGGGGHVGATRIGFVLLGLLLYLTVLGPSLVRVDLRIDIPHFDVLKSMPLRGRSVIFGEVMGSVVVLWVIQLVGCLVAAFLITEESGVVFAWSDKLPALFGLLCAFVALDFVLLTLENLLALWLPGFVRLGRGMKPSLDQMGQNLLGALMRVFALMILLVPAVLVGAGVLFAVRLLGPPPVISIVAGVVCGAAVLIVASYAMIRLSEARYDRFDITSENTATD